MLIQLDTLIRKYRVRPSGVLHVGANIGEEAESYDNAGIKNVVWIEANPAIYEILKLNIAKYEGHRALNFCIGDYDGKDVVFHVSNNAGQSSSVLELGTHKQAHPEVNYIEDIPMKTHRIDSVLKSHDWSLFPMDFLNIDLQGFELQALRGMGSLLNKFKWAYLEVNKKELYKGCALIDEIDAYMRQYGFKRVATSWAGNTGWGDSLYIKS